MTKSDDVTVDNPGFARLWSFMARHERKAVRAMRRKNLAGLTGRVLEVGAGTGTNFALYPATVEEVVAVEPEARLAEEARAAAASAPVPVSVRASTIEALGPDDQFDAVVCALVLCSVDDPGAVLRELFSRLRPGGQLRYMEHVASPGARGRLQQVADATIWPRIAGNCHTHRHTERTIAAAGFRSQLTSRARMFPAWVPLPVSEVAVGRAVRPVG